MLSEVEKLEKGLEYCFEDEEVFAIKQNAIKKCEQYNNINPLDKDKQYEFLKEFLGTVGENVDINKVFNCDCGANIHIGNNFLANFNFTVLDVREVYIGDNVMIGPNTLITTVGHPLSPKGRREHLGQAEPVHIGNDVWIGGNVTILPGVKIGDNVVIGAGAVVSRDIPSNSLALGVPARVIRELENDI